MKLSIVIVTYNSAKEIGECLGALHQTIKALPFEVIVIDNASKDATAEVVRTYLRKYPEIKLVCNELNTGFPTANNQAFSMARGEYVLMLNPDTIVQPSAVELLVSALDNDRSIGACGPQLVDGMGIPAPDLRQLTLGRLILETLGFLRFECPLLPPTRQQALSGAAIAFRKDVLDQVGGLDEQMFYGEDIDFCRRVLDEGLQVQRLEAAVVVHLEGRSSATNIAAPLERRYKSRIRFLRKYSRTPAYWLAMPFFLFEIVQRLAKWQIKAMFAPSAEASVRIRTFRSLMRDLPQLFMLETRRYASERGSECSAYGRTAIPPGF